MQGTNSTRPHYYIATREAVCHACRQKYGVDPIKGSREALLLVCADFAIEPPQPMPPHVKMVGGILTAPAKPLPADLEARTRATFSTLVVRAV